VQPVGATGTQVTVHGDEDGQLGLLSFGVAELTARFPPGTRSHHPRSRTLAGNIAATATSAGGVPHSVNLSSSTVSVRGHDETSLLMTLSIPAANRGRHARRVGQCRLRGRLGNHYAHTRSVLEQMVSRSACRTTP